uniref:Transcription initiation factor TFIID subunit 8 n=1 Tax=Chelonoidis abingdonii TaxID=106734 RepID=A0A8C0IRF3_CHEAB
TRDEAAAARVGGFGPRSGGKHSTTPADNYYLARRRTLQVVVSSLLTEAGFESAEKAAVETLTEMLQSYVSEIGRSAKSYCEHTARTQPTLSDIVVTLVEMGFNVETLPAYAKRSQRMVITAPPVTNQPVTPKALTAGQNKPHPSHIPGHFPEFPDPHTYIKTPVSGKDFTFIVSLALQQQQLRSFNIGLIPIYLGHFLIYYESSQCWKCTEL